MSQNKINVSFIKMVVTGDHHVKWNKQNLERQILQVFSHMQNKDVNICVCTHT